MKKQVFILLYVGILGSLLLSSCRRKDDEVKPDNHTHKKESFEPSLNAKLVVADATNNIVSVYHLNADTINRFTVAHNRPSVYAATRFAVIVHRDQNMTEYLDAGAFLDHGSHQHNYTPTLLPFSTTSQLPTHFLANKNAGLSVLFNDGDGTLTLIRHTSLRTGLSAAVGSINFGGVAHHGASYIFDNGNIAVTVKKAGTAGSLPQWVKIINASGSTLFEDSTVQVGNIHGEAGNGKTAVFGGSTGVIMVTQNGGFSLVANHTNLTTTSGEWLGTLESAYSLQKAYGFARRKGIYKVDFSAKNMTEVLSDTSIRGIKVTPNGSYLVALTVEGELLAYNTATDGQISRSGQKFGITPTSDPSRALVLSDKHAYLTEPISGKIKVYSLPTLNFVKDITITTKPSSIAFTDYGDDDAH